MKEYGYFDNVNQTTPAYDPGLSVPCLICEKVLSVDDIRTVSLMIPNDGRSYFYRVHKSCHEPLDEQARVALDGRLIDVIAVTNEHVN